MTKELKLSNIKLNTIIRQSEKKYTRTHRLGGKSSQPRVEILELKIDKLNIDFTIKKLVYCVSEVINNNENDNLDFKTLLQNYTEENKYMNFNDFKTNLKEIIFNHFTAEIN